MAKRLWCMACLVSITFVATVLYVRSSRLNRARINSDARVLITGTGVRRAITDSCAGAAGFIGYSLASDLLAQGCLVVGVDNFDPFYDIQLKEARVGRMQSRHARFVFVRGGKSRSNGISYLGF
jgi:hypothetical protein